MLIDLVTNYSVKPLYQDKKSGKRYIHLGGLLAFIMVYPYSASFQKARSAVFTFMMTYTETICQLCGFIRRDCQCSNPFWREGVAKCFESRLSQFMSDEKSTQTRSSAVAVDTINIFDDEEGAIATHTPAPRSTIPPPPMLYLPTGQRAVRIPNPVPRVSISSMSIPQPICHTPVGFNPTQSFGQYLPIINPTNLYSTHSTHPGYPIIDPGT